MYKPAGEYIRLNSPKLVNHGIDFKIRFIQYTFGYIDIYHKL